MSLMSSKQIATSVKLGGNSKFRLNVGSFD